MKYDFWVWRPNWFTAQEKQLQLFLLYNRQMNQQQEHCQAHSNKEHTDSVSYVLQWTAMRYPTHLLHSFEYRQTSSKLVWVCFPERLKERFLIEGATVLRNRSKTWKNRLGVLTKRMNVLRNRLKLWRIRSEFWWRGGWLYSEDQSMSLGERGWHFGGSGQPFWRTRCTFLLVHLFGLARVAINSFPCYSGSCTPSAGVSHSAEWGEGLFTQWPLPVPCLAQLSKGLPHCIHIYLQSGPGLNQTFDILIARHKPSKCIQHAGPPLWFWRPFSCNKLQVQISTIHSLNVSLKCQEVYIKKYIKKEACAELMSHHIWLIRKS